MSKTAHTLLPAQGYNKYWLVNFFDFNNSQARKNANGGSAYSPNNQYYNANSQATAGPSTFDWRQWHDLKIRWVPDTASSTGWRTDWFAKRPSDTTYTFLRSERQASPNKWMTVRFNCWAPGPDFGVAYTNGSPPATGLGQPNTIYHLDVDWVKVTQATAPAVTITQVNGVSNPTGKVFPA